MKPEDPVEEWAPWALVLPTKNPRAPPPVSVQTAPGPVWDIEQVSTLILTDRAYFEKHSSRKIYLKSAYCIDMYLFRRHNSCLGCSRFTLDTMYLIFSDASKSHVYAYSTIICSFKMYD